MRDSASSCPLATPCAVPSGVRHSVDGGRFDWRAQALRYPQFTEPDPAFNQVVFTERYPAFPLAARVRTVMLRNGGAALAASDRRYRRARRSEAAEAARGAASA